MEMQINNSDFTQRLWLKGPLSSWAAGPGPGSQFGNPSLNEDCISPTQDPVLWWMLTEIR